MYLKRKVYDQLLDWKNDTVHSTLEVNGARQVGKTYIINKFADENFRCCLLGTFSSFNKALASSILLISNSLISYHMILRTYLSWQ